MDRAGVKTSREVLCPECEAELDGHADPSPTRGTGARCPRCGAEISPDTGTRVTGRTTASPPNPAPPLGGFVLVWRNWVLRLAEADVLDRNVCRFVDLTVVRWFCSRGARLAPRRNRRLVRGRRYAGGRVVRGRDQRPRQRSRAGSGPGRRTAPFLDDRKGGTTPGGQTALPGPPDLLALLRCGGLGPVAGLAHRAPALSRAHPGRAKGHRRPRAGPPGAGRRHGGGSLGPVCRGTRTGRRTKRPARSRSPGCLGSLLPARGVMADRARGARTRSAGRSVCRGDRRWQRRRVRPGQGRRRSTALPRSPRGLRPQPTPAI